MSKTHSECLICRSTDIKNLNGYEKKFLVKCNQCSFVFSGLIPSTEELVEHYEKYNRDNLIISQVTIKRYHEILDSFEQFRKTNNILDVGCGVGFFLEIAKLRGWNVYGTEFSDKAIKICEDKGIKMKKGSLNCNDFEPDFFDIITSFEVIEHINNPLSEIRNFKAVLRTNGLVYITTPNFNSIERYLLKQDYNVIEYPEHLSYYTKITLNNLFVSNGFKKLNISSTGISVSRIKHSRSKKVAYSLKKLNKKDFDKEIRELSESSKFGLLIKSFINKALNLSSLGNSLKGYFIKI
jgi:2-polyprenyl-3-methyl-5-hydroxy-6-metoxy-1,4-benzoquinol methylase